MREMPPLSLIAACALAVAGCSTFGPSPDAPSGSSSSDSTAAWNALDTNSDGSLTRDELSREAALPLLQDFRRADANGDRMLSKAEWDAWWPSMSVPASY